MDASESRFQSLEIIQIANMIFKIGIGDLSLLVDNKNSASIVWRLFIEAAIKL